VDQKCLLFVNVYTIENVNAGGRWSKKSQNLVRVVCEQPLRFTDQTKHETIWLPSSIPVHDSMIIFSINDRKDSTLYCYWWINISEENFYGAPVCRKETKWSQLQKCWVFINLCLPLLNVYNTWYRSLMKKPDQQKSLKNHINYIIYFAFLTSNICAKNIWCPSLNSLRFEFFVRKTAFLKIHFM
jgi:hypothetical protein